MLNATVDLAGETATSLTDKFIEFASGLPYDPCLTPDNKAAQDMLFEAVSDEANRKGVDMNTAYCRVTGEIADKLGTTREQLTQGVPSALKSAVRKIGLRCGSGAPGWSGCQ